MRSNKDPRVALVYSLVYREPGGVPALFINSAFSLKTDDFGAEEEGFEPSIPR